MTDPVDRSGEFEALWDASLARAQDAPQWPDLTLEEQKTLSARFRRALEKYGREKQTGNRMEGGAYASPKSSNGAG